MTGYTAHLKPGRPPILVREGWSWGCFLFGPFFFTSHRAWLPAAFHVALLGIAASAPSSLRGVLLTALAVLAGLMGRDALRWALDRRGYVVAHVVVARDDDGALGRLLQARPDLVAGMAGLDA